MSGNKDMLLLNVELLRQIEDLKQQVTELRDALAVFLAPAGPDAVSQMIWPKES